MAGSAKGAVGLAVVGNAFLTILKFVAFFASGSGAMFSEAIHSLADTGNQALLFIGIERSGRPANARFHYGYGAARYFYALMSAVGIFVLGCGVTVYHGLHMLQDPPEIELTWLPFAVLGVSFVVDAFVLSKALQIARAALLPGEGLLEHLKSSSDPTLAAVLLEDGVATVGVVVALLALSVSALTGSVLPDAIATLLIGAMMGFVAVWLGVQNKSLILGQAIPVETQAVVTDFLRDQPTIERVTGVRTRIVGAEHFKFQAEIDWDGREFAERLLPWVESQKGLLRNKEGRREFARAFGELLTEALGDEIDRLEDALRARFPELAYLDFESE